MYMGVRYIGESGSNPTVLGVKKAKWQRGGGLPWGVQSLEASKK